MTLERRKVEHALESKGFTRRDKKKHVHFIYHAREGKLKTSVWTMTSRGSSGEDIDRSLIAVMARQCKIGGGDFKRLIDCSFSQKGYERLLIDRGAIKPNPPGQ